MRGCERSGANPAKRDGRYKVNKNDNVKDARVKKRAAATLRSRTAGSQDESPCRAIHKVKSKIKGAQARLPTFGGRAYATSTVTRPSA
jgi:hypothetical protein